MSGPDRKRKCAAIWDRISRRKIIESQNTKTVLNRYLTTTHLTFMGVGATVGVGIYVLIGSAAKDIAGPGLLLAFVFAGMVTMLNAVIYAEFGSRIPTTGASYTYVYESMCEGLAFIVGWLILLGYLTSGAIGCRAWSGYFDSLFDGAIHNMTKEHLGAIGLESPFSDHYDVVASILELVAMVIVAIGIHTSANVNIVLSLVSVVVLVFVTIMGFAIGDVENVTNKENGGFLPFGFGGVIVATTSCFYAYNGYDVICMSAEESKTPHKSVPRAILLELILVTVLYAGSSFAMIMLTPYNMIDVRAPLPSAFEYRGIIWAKYIVTIGPVLGIGNLSLLNLYSTSRHIYCMSNDGLLLKVCGVVNKKAKVPLVAVIITGLIIAVSALILDLSNLVKFNVLAIYSCNIILSCGLLMIRTNGDVIDSESSKRKSSREKGTSGFVHRLRIEILLVVLVMFAVLLASLIVWQPVFSKNPNIPAVVFSVLSAVCIIGLTFVIKLKLKPNKYTGFKVPFVPFLPVLNIVMNIILLLYSTEVQGLISFIVLVLVGYVVYFLMIVISNSRRDGTITNYSKLPEENMDLMTVEEIDN